MPKSSEKTTAKVVYKPDSQSVDEYIAILGDVQAYKNWKGGDKWVIAALLNAVDAYVARRTIPLIDVLDSFDIFTTGQGKQGILERPSKQILDNVFGTSKDDECMNILLEKGELQETKSVSMGSFNSNALPLTPCQHYTQLDLNKARREDSGLSRGSNSGGSHGGR